MSKHDSRIRRRGRFWKIRYFVNGVRHEESSRSEKYDDALRLLKIRQADAAKGMPVSPKLGRLRFDEAAADVINDYSTNGKRSLDVLQQRIRGHLTPFFGGRRMTAITTADVRTYIADRQTEGASNGTINRELTALKRAFSLACQAGKLLVRPHIPLLKETNTRTGFFEPLQIEAVIRQLPAALQPVIRFAYITGWRIDSEVLALEWRNIDFSAGEVRLDPHVAKNDEGRVFPFTRELRTLLEAQYAEHERLKKANQIVPLVFVRMVAKGRRGPKFPKLIIRFNKAWKTACEGAGCPGRIPHDLRRTAVRNLVRAGVPERVAMMMTGHKTRSVFERYNIVSASDLKAAARTLDAAQVG